jgi:predicted metal-dependent peptidase
MQVKKGDFVIVDVDTVEPGGNPAGQDKPQSKDQSSSPQELERAPDQIDKPGLDIGGNSGAGYERSGNIQKGGSSKKYSSQKSLGQGGTKAEASAKWENALRDAISRAGSTLSDKARRLLAELKSSKPKVDWKRELKKFMDSAMTKFDDVLPNKRFLAGGDILYGTELSGKDTLKTLVLPVDTSGSISKDQIGSFLTEVFSLATKFDIDTTYIVYTSDSIDSIDVVQ